MASTGCNHETCESYLRCLAGAGRTGMLKAQQYVYAKDGCVYLQHTPDNSDSQARFRNSQGMSFGQRFDVVKQDGPFFQVTTPLGAEGWILKEAVTEKDPRAWFAGEWKGRKIVGYWRTGHCNPFGLDPFAVQVEGQRIEIPINQVKAIQVGPETVTITRESGRTITSDKDVWNPIYTSSSSIILGEVVYNSDIAKLKAGVGTVIEIKRADMSKSPLKLERIATPE